MKIKKAIIPVAGFGTRFLPATKALPKTMLPIVDKPAIHYLVEEAVASGIEEIFIITGEDKEVFEKYFNRSKELEDHLTKTGKGELLKQIRSISNMADISFVIQENPEGLGHAIYCARKFISREESFAILLGDDIVYSEKPCLSQLIEVSSQYKANVVGVQYVPEEKVSFYGIVNGNNITDRIVDIIDLVEKPDKANAPSNIAIMGRYIIHSDIFDILSGTEPGKGGEIQLTDALKELNKTQKLCGYLFEGTRYDIGDKLGYLKATTEFALQSKEVSEKFKNYLASVFKKGNYK